MKRIAYQDNNNNKICKHEEDISASASYETGYYD